MTLGGINKDHLIVEAQVRRARTAFDVAFWATGSSNTLWMPYTEPSKRPPSFLSWTIGSKEEDGNRKRVKFYLISCPELCPYKHSLPLYYKSYT